MDKIILLDWDGPISNSRTWDMPNQVDPVAIQMLNDLTVAGWQTVLTSTIRKHFDKDSAGEPTSNMEALAIATQFMRDRGFNVRWYKQSWRTDSEYTAKRYLEVATWMMDTDLPEDAVFLAVDDEVFPDEFLSRGRMAQIYANCDEGICSAAIKQAYRYMDMPDIALIQAFEPNEENQ